MQSTFMLNTQNFWFRVKILVTEHQTSTCCPQYDPQFYVFTVKAAPKGSTSIPRFAEFVKNRQAAKPVTPGMKNT